MDEFVSALLTQIIWSTNKPKMNSQNKCKEKCKKVVATCLQEVNHFFCSVFHYFRCDFVTMFIERQGFSLPFFLFISELLTK